MPDGSSLKQHLKSQKHSDTASEIGGKANKSKSTKRGKDLLFAHVVHQRARLTAAVQSGAGDAGELAELRALEAVGVRRRRRWLNDRILREMTGPMSLEQMEAQFKPAPFGYRAPSALEIIARPQHAAVWEGFRTIDADREERLLARWAEHNRQQGAGGREGAGPTQRGGQTPEAQALARWARIGKKARAALRKANVHAVLALEAQLLQYLEECVVPVEAAAATTSAPAGSSPGAAPQSSPAPEPLLLGGLDGWGRLLVHGLADYYGLGSSSRALSSVQSGMVVWPEQVQAGEQGQQGDGVVVAVYPHTSKAAAAHQSAPAPAVTASDVLLALSALGGEVSEAALAAYVRTHIHGSVSSCAPLAEGVHEPVPEDWVVV
eukprot:CAMPEP_0202863686 /NCGR_PEP_ID=MMETSP1391-20130828/4221_1 /ASSEMBLY_ACC=CAM_ASM_000867 /TAXON_ID=1034604 /ORGANISM="Chlamydomonas leiostraca, Strain SAG 11-49" /LENGTH=377 /DNA_ID=CAMNT_0049543345 /DNA_START=163 /DNA_END=1296 /DNA_ORIENTATION=+